MSKLEPTLTNSDLMATERLRELLDERGVEWTEGIARPELTQVRIDGKVAKFHPWQPNTLKVSLFDITPEQAIAATLGTAPRLPHFWTHDGTLHIELPKLPESIQVLLPDQRDREVGSARVWCYTRDNGTCRITDNGPWGYPYVCSACGASFDPDVNGGDFNYCPNCGRKAVDA